MIAALSADASAEEKAPAEPDPSAAEVEATPKAPTPDDEVIEITDRAPETAEPIQYEMTPEVIRRVPGAGNDALKSLQTMPGVGRVPFGMGGLVLRGTSPRDSNVFIDGIEVPLLYHFGGLASFYPSTLLSSMNLTPGGYSVEFGRGQGGMVELRSASGHRDRWRVASEISMMDASLRADGPAAGGAWNIALRRSYIDALLPLYSTDADLTTAPRYWDGQLRYEVPLWTDATLALIGFGSDDEIAMRYGLNQAKSFQFTTRFARVGARLQQRIGRTSLELIPWIGLDRYFLASTFQTMRSENAPRGGRAKVRTESALGSFSAGIDISAGDFTVASLTEDEDGMVTEIERAQEYSNGALWAEGLIRAAGGKVHIRPGVRIDHFGLPQTTTVDPRLVLTERVADSLLLKQSIGVFHQPPSVADYIWGNDMLEPSKSVQLSAGGTLSVGQRAEVTLTGFYSELYDLAVDDPFATDDNLNNLETYKIGALASSREFMAKQFGSFSKLANVGRGRVYGAEIIARYVGPRGFAWFAYTYSRSWRQTTIGPDTERRNYVLDQPHVLTALGSLRLGRSWRIGARIRLASGNPITPLEGRTQVDTDEWEPIFGPDYSERLPAFVQLDARLDRQWKRDWGTISLFLDVQNVTRRANIEGRVYDDDYSGFESTKGLPLFPSFGIEYTPAP